MKILPICILVAAICLQVVTSDAFGGGVTARSAHRRWEGRTPRPYGNPYQRPSDLLGYCEDFDHSQFMTAKEFAYSGNGLDLDSNQSVQWALQYNETHNCNTIQEYSSRFAALYQYAYAGNYLDMDGTHAREYAAKHADYIRVSQIEDNKNVFAAVDQFFYAGNYLDNDSATSIAAAKEWIDRGYCEGAEVIDAMKGRFTSEYQFAYSGNGLNLSSQQAKNYAIAKIARMSVCGDLLK